MKHDNHTARTVLKIAAGVSAVLLAFSMRGMLPELYRYLRIRRM